MNYAHHNNKANKQIPSEEHAKSTPAEKAANDVLRFSGKFLVFFLCCFFFRKNKQIIINVSNKIIHSKPPLDVGDIKAGKYNFMLKQNSRFVLEFALQLSRRNVSLRNLFVICCERYSSSRLETKDSSLSRRYGTIHNFSSVSFSLNHR